jgi:hypothetical protein
MEALEEALEEDGTAVAIGCVPNNQALLLAKCKYTHRSRPKYLSQGLLNVRKRYRGVLVAKRKAQGQKACSMFQNSAGACWL